MLTHNFRRYATAIRIKIVCSDFEQVTRFTLNEFIRSNKCHAGLLPSVGSGDGSFSVEKYSVELFASGELERLSRMLRMVADFGVGDNCSLFGTVVISNDWLCPDAGLMSIGVFTTGFCVLFNRIAVVFACDGGFGFGRAIAMRLATAAVGDATGVTSNFLVINCGLAAPPVSLPLDACACGIIFR